MINVQSARNLLNQVSPKIREYWEKENNISLTASIAEIESIETKTMSDEGRINTYSKAAKILLLIILSTILLMGVLTYSYPIIKPLYIHSMLLMIFFAFIAFLKIELCVIKLSNKSHEYRLDQVNQQEILSGKVRYFWDTILKVCENYTLPSDKSVDAEYIKKVLIGDIEDLLLKKALYGARRNNPNIDLDNEVLSALAYNKADLHLDTRWKIVTDELGVNLNKKEMFIEAVKEMRKTYPALSEYFIVE